MSAPDLFKRGALIEERKEQTRQHFPGLSAADDIVDFRIKEVPVRVNPKVQSDDSQDLSMVPEEFEQKHIESENAMEDVHSHHELPKINYTSPEFFRALKDQKYRGIKRTYDHGEKSGAMELNPATRAPWHWAENQKILAQMAAVPAPACSCPRPALRK